MTVLDSHPLLDSAITNLTCHSPMDALHGHLANKSDCQLTGSQLQTEFLLTFYVPILLCCSGVCLNLGNFFVLRKQQFEGPAYAYMAAISMVDALFLVFYTLYVISALRCADHQLNFPCTAKAFRLVQFDLTVGSVRLMNTVNVSLQTVCAWLSVILGVERYLAMRYFHFRRTRCQTADTRLVVAVVCLASFLLNLPNSFALKISTQEQADGNRSRVRTIEGTEFGKSAVYSAFSLGKLIASTLLPCALLAVNNTLLLVQVVSHRRRRAAAALREGSTASARASKVLQASLNRIQAQRNLTILLIVVIFVFLCGQVPRSLMFKEVFTRIYSGCPCGSALLWLCCPLYRRLYPLCELVYLVSLNLNFFIYAGLNKHFRAQLKLPSARCCPAKPRHPPSAGVVGGGGGGGPAGEEMDLFSAAGATTVGCSQQVESNTTASAERQQQLQQLLSHGNGPSPASDSEEGRSLMVSQL